VGCTIEIGPLQAALRKILSRGGEHADIFVEQRKGTFLQREEGRIEKLVSGVDRGVGMRLISGGKTAYGFGNDLSPHALIDLAATLSRAFQGAATDLTLDLRRMKPDVDFTIAKPPAETPVEWKIRLLESADHAARSSDIRIKQVTGTYRDSEQKVLVVNSEGTIAEDERIHTLAALHVVASDGNLVQTGYEAIGGQTGLELFDTFPFEETALKACRRALMMLTARRAPGGRMPIVISSEAGGTMIHEAIGHGLEADLAQQGLSVYSRKIGMEIAAEIVTVIDDSTLPGKRGSFRFDDEGVSSRRTVLVDKGRLAGYMYDRLTALRDGVTSTGNGRRESYRHRPIPRMTNTFIAPGESAPEDVIKTTPEGLFVKKMGGGQVNTVGGDFVFDVQEGYMIRDGEICEPVRGATLSGSGPSVLKSIDMVASDLGFSIGTCGKDSQGVPVSDAMPTVRIKEMVVGGEVNL